MRSFDLSMGLEYLSKESDLRVNVVHSYKHVRCIQHMMFLDNRASCAMTSYVPLAGRVFSSPFIDVMCKRAFTRALVEFPSDA